MKRFHRPKRTCLGCGQRDEADRMFRLSVGTNSDLEIGRSRGGRSGYLHPARPCGDAFTRRKSVYRAFHAEISRGAREKLVRLLNTPSYIGY